MFSVFVTWRLDP